ncbi:MAG: hypothetical protein ACI8ZM_002768 [Crocinitomix sp.]|jgi:hypothetical protein
MRILFALVLLHSNISISQMDDFNRLKNEAEIAFGYHHKVYPDTFYVDYYCHETIDLYFQRIITDSLLGDSERYAYRRADSSALNGTIMRQNIRPSHTYIQTASLYENGQLTSAVTRSYYNMLRVNSPPPNINLLKKFDHKKHGYSLIKISRGGYQIGFYQNKITHIEYQKQAKNSDESLYEAVFFHLNGQIKQYHFRQLKEGINYENDIDINEIGDTISMESMIDYRRYGLCIKRISRDDLSFQLRTVWKNDSLLDVLNTNILFTNHKNNIISKQEFCSLVYHGINAEGNTNSNHWNTRAIPPNLRVSYNIPHTVVLSSNLERDFYFLKSESRRTTHEEALEAFFKKNKKRIEALDEN